MEANKTIRNLILTAFISLNAAAQPAMFPVVSSPVQITNGKEHLFASYYGINSWSKNERYATVLETDVRDRIPTGQDTATLGLVDMRTNKFIPLTKTTAWNLQQGCMAHWLATNPNSVIIYNDMRNGRYVSVILNVLSRKELKVIPYPVAAVSPDGKEAVVINFSRLRITRTDYGYPGGGQDAQPNVQFPDNDGIFLLNLKTGAIKLIVSLAQLKSQVPEIKASTGIEYIGHTLFSKGGTKIFFLARAIPDWNTTSFTINKDGSDLRRCFPDDWGGSHFDWLNDRQLLVTALYDGEQNSHILFTVGKNDYRKLGSGKLDYDGHGTFSPNGKWLVTDTYPAKNREQSIYLLNMKTDSVVTLGRFIEPPVFKDGWRADIHCRWSPKGDMIGFNSTHTGSRQVYVMKVKE
ncbi:MAG: hypothetical protein M3139_00025 [Bacteroidota bacterium]|nr:hypothetical protein [Bacteroidota bacterium]